MGTWKALLVAYVLGGVTFIPLLIVAVLAHAYYTFPNRGDVDLAQDDAADAIVQPGDDTAALDASKTARTDSDEPKTRVNKHDLDVAAGYFAVCREYTPMGINAKPIERSTPVGSATVAPPSPSVYQTMYRSIFDRKPVPGPLDNNSMSNRPRKAGNIFYVVLRHGHLMLFDDDEQLEVRHVISLANHDISIYSGGDTTPEGELFIKRNALCLLRKRDGLELKPDSQVSKPFYLFSENCSAKEDFYFALLKNQESTFGPGAPAPKQFEVASIISLVQKLHSSEDHLHSRWLNAMLGRLFLAVYKTRDMENLIREKITKKISRVKRPSFLTNITIQRIDIGEAAPYFTNLKLKDLTVEGECVIEADVKYTGNFRIEVATTAKIDLGTRFKAREVNLVLAVLLKRMEGHILFKVKPPPSNRVWFSFQTMPKMEMAIEPIVSSRQITYTVILRQIENRIKEVLAETLVQPFWDDVPFFKTEHKTWRGGIFENDDAVKPTDNGEVAMAQAGDAESVDSLEDNQNLLNETRPMEKSQSFPIADLQQPLATGIFGRKLGRTGTNPAAAVSSMSVDASKSSGISTARSPAIVKNSTEAVVGTAAAHADLFKPSSSPPDQASNFMSALHSRSQEASQAASPMLTPVGSPAKPSSLTEASSYSSGGAAVDKDDETETTPALPPRRNTASSTESSIHGDGSVPDSPTTSAGSSFKTQAGSLGRNLFLRRDDSSTSVSTNSVNGDGSHKRNTLLAVTNAAVQARQWGWNAIQRQKEARRNSETASHVDLSQPMGRGQPLPPPGTPLPGPLNGQTGLGPTPSTKRKPVPPSLPERPPAEEGAERSVPMPPPLPHRRRRGESQQEDLDEDPNILVVAAPDDSQPGTPVAEDKLEYMDVSEADNRTPAVDSASEQTPKEEPVSARSTSPHELHYARGPIIIKESSFKDVEEESLSADEKLDGPIMAMPAAMSTAADEDEDDYSGWMEDEAFSNEDQGETLSPVVAEEFRAKSDQA